MVYQADPLLCTRCGKRMGLIAFVTDQVAIGQLLGHLGLRGPEAEKPPARDVLRVAEHGDGCPSLRRAVPRGPRALSTSARGHGFRGGAPVLDRGRSRSWVCVRAFVMRARYVWD